MGQKYSLLAGHMPPAIISILISGLSYTLFKYMACCLGIHTVIFISFHLTVLSVYEKIRECCVPMIATLQTSYFGPHETNSHSYLLFYYNSSQPFLM
jgi:hypothetical protein